MERAIVERILIVEDDPATLGWLLAELSALPGVHAGGCASVAEARRWLGAQAPHIVLTDLGLGFGATVLSLTKLMGIGEATASRELMELHCDAIEVDV